MKDALPIDLLIGDLVKNLFVNIIWSLLLVYLWLKGSMLEYVDKGVFTFAIRCIDVEF
jgi:hypothetical protein